MNGAFDGYGKMQPRLERGIYHARLVIMLSMLVKELTGRDQLRAWREEETDLDALEVR